jgi:hypothetical protein
VGLHCRGPSDYELNVSRNNIFNTKIKLITGIRQLISQMKTTKYVSRSRLMRLDEMLLNKI